VAQVPPKKDIAGLSKQEKRALLENLLRKESRAEHVRLSEAQLRLWELEAHLAPGGIHSFAIAYFLRGSLHHEVLERAIQCVAARHDALRMRIVIVNGEPFLEVGPPGNPFEQRDCQLPGIDREQMLRAEAAHSLDLMAGAAWRCVLFRCGDENVLLLQFHHIIADRWSVAIFVTDLGIAYRALLQG